MDFTGGPWLLRNGEKVYLEKATTGYGEPEYYICHELKNHHWDMEGNCGGAGYGQDKKSYDIMESLNNWKYLRGYE